MKRCPTCNRIETDETLKFCRVDGTVLVNVDPADELEPTRKLSSPESERPTARGIATTGHRAVRRTWIQRRKYTISIVAVILVLSTAGLGLYLHARNTEVAIDSIAVLPFQNRNTDSDTEYLSDGLAESLIYRLSQLPNLRVSPTSVVFRYKGQEIDPVNLGKQLGVSAVLSGRITERGDNLTISAELVDVRYNKLLWGEQYDRKVSELLATQREIAREIAESLKLKVSGEERGLAKHYTESNEAYQLYMKGRFYFNKRTEDGLDKSLQYYKQAIEKDPNFALAYAGLADTYDLFGAPGSGGSVPPNDVLPNAKDAALRAIELDPTLAEPHVSLAHVKYYYDRDWAGADREFTKAIELNPNYAQAHHWYAIYLVWIGRSDQGIAEIRHAQQLDPLSLPVNMALGWLLCDTGRTDEGIEELHKTLDMDPAFVAARVRLGACYERKGMYPEAINEFQKVSNVGSKWIGIAGLARVHATVGNRDQAEKFLAELLEMSKQRYVAPATVGLVYAALGDKDQAFAWLNKAVEAHDLEIARLKVDPTLDKLRSDPRFGELLKRVGLPQ